MKFFNPECEMIGINYGQEFPWDSIQKDEWVFMVDFTLQPFDGMERLRDWTYLTWIDHHKTEIEESTRRGFMCDGIRAIGTGACELTWRFLNPDPDAMLPLSIRLLSEYDVWNHADHKTLPFQYGVRMEPDTLPTNQVFWKRLFNDGGYVRQFIINGELLLKYEEQQNAKFCKAYAFETQLSCTVGEHFEVNHFKAICANRGFTNSKVFDSVYNPARHDLMITFCRLKPPVHKWTVSLYSTKEDIDCGMIAKTFGGGGHKGAAGFQCEQLPFEH